MVSEVSPHRPQQVAVCRTVPEPLNNCVDSLCLIDVGKACSLRFCPLSHSIPAPTVPLLSHSCTGILHWRSVHRCIVGLTNDVLQQVIHAMDNMKITVHLVMVVVAKSYPSSDFALIDQKSQLPQRRYGLSKNKQDSVGYDSRSIGICSGLHSRRKG